MNRNESNNSLGEKIKWASYGLVGGLFMGMVLGWMLHGFIGLIVRFIILLVILAPFVGAFLFWQKVKSGRRSTSSDAAIRDAEWREAGRRR